MPFKVRCAQRLLLLVCIAVTLTLLCSRASNGQTSSEQIKAVFLVKFFDYVTWPAGKSPDTGSVGRICLLGGNPFGKTLSYVASKKGGAVKYKVQEIASAGEAKQCHVLFASGGSYGDLKNIEGNSGVLIVGERSGLHAAGGIIQIFEKNDKIQLSINLENARDQDLKISSRLLDIAEVEK